MRNPTLGRCFFLTKYIEEWGTGTNRIIEKYVEMGLPEPLFEEVSESLVVTFRKYKVDEEILDELNHRQRKAIKHLKENKRIERRTYSNIFEIEATTAYKELDEMIEKGIINRREGGEHTMFSERKVDDPESGSTPEGLKEKPRTDDPQRSTARRADLPWSWCFDASDRPRVFCSCKNIRTNRIYRRYRSSRENRSYRPVCREVTLRRCKRHNPSKPRSLS